MPRGSDFTARWYEGAWAELRILEALNKEPDVLAVQFGITNGEAFWSTREMAARVLPDQNKHGKRPDVLVFRPSELTPRELDVVREIYSLDDDACEDVVKKAKIAIESEFSPYNYTHRIEKYGKHLSFTVKDEDLAPLVKWRTNFQVEIGIVQVFLDSAFFLTVGSLLKGIADGSIKKTRERSYNKDVYYPPMTRGFSFGNYTSRPEIAADLILDKYGKYTAYRVVTGGEMKISDEIAKLI